MLKKLKITNLAIIDSLEIDFSDSFNVITGESGAGKTIIYKSINYLFGSRFNKNDLRNAQDIPLLINSFFVASRNMLEQK